LLHFVIENRFVMTVDVVASSGSMIVVSNRLPFVLQRDTDGKLVRKAR
jgi:hypothetical protein